MKNINTYLIAIAIVLMAMAVAISVRSVIQGPGEARVSINIVAQDGYQEELESAMSIWNAYVGCEFLLTSKDALVDTLVKSGDGAPCGDTLRPDDEWGHAATAYGCPDGTFQILIEQPGNTNTQAALIAHEIGHRLSKWGVDHHWYGVMSKTTDPNGGKQNVLRIRDRDADAVRKHFCYD